MLGVLHWEPNNGEPKEAMFVEKPHGSCNVEKSPACSRCRARKVMSQHLEPKSYLPYTLIIFVRSSNVISKRVILATGAQVLESNATLLLKLT